jgi:predicted flavoprotein YhiN
LKGWRIGEAGDVPLDRGEVSAGGIALSEVSPTTMESKQIRGLYFAGEVLDISGCVGGYNLQAAFSTGFVAGKKAGKMMNDE